MMRYINKKYKLARKENYDPYLRTMKFNLFTRKISSVQKPIIRLQERDGKYVFETFSILGDTSVVFRPGVSFDEILLDGTPAKSVIEFEDNKMIYMISTAGAQVKYVYEFSDKEVNVTLTCNDIVCTMVYTRMIEK
ncbi:UNVERIFIED_CONTAM: hypothetical protein PYX00_005864 [Menopon gallinae]|uniref:Uncharacterized protein n=1 Tax=Menopon gallinae TaxID=328185 RepID=A0AAW2HSV9_9NEOP